MWEGSDNPAQPIHPDVPNVFWEDRLLSGRDWWTIGTSGGRRDRNRFTLYSVKGGVGRSTTAVVLAWHLARRGERVLVVDLDLESPGLSSAILAPERQQRFGVADWFVEDLVGQGDDVVRDILAEPAWSQDLEGDVRVACAHGREPGEYLAKLGRLRMDGPGRWAHRLNSLLFRLEQEFRPSVVLVESRSGLSDIAAATVTDLGADVLLFATDSESSWTDYRILLRHFSGHGLISGLRERLFLVSALTPEIDMESYLARFRENTWRLFLEHVYDELKPGTEPGDEFSFDLHEEHAPHDPAVILWTVGFAAGASLRTIERAPARKAYSQFLQRFDQQLAAARSYDARD